MSARRNPVVAQHDKFRKPSRPCVWCGLSTTSPKGTCGACKFMDLKLAKVPQDCDALPPGCWAPRGGILVFQAGLRQPTEAELREDWAS